MLIAVYTILILLLTWPLMAEIRMVLHSIFHASVGRKKGKQLLQEMPWLRRVTLCGMKPHLTRLTREYGQYMRLQAGLAVCAALAIALEVLLVEMRLGTPALIVCIVYCAVAFAGISLVHAHAGYDPEKHTTRYDRAA